jgi:hypothetical protein
MDSVWKHRRHSDYEDPTFPVFMRNLGKSYVFNFQSRSKRGELGGVRLITLTSANPDTPGVEFYQNFGKGALQHEANFETPEGLRYSTS